MCQAVVINSYVNSLSEPILLLIFGVAAAAIWIAGIQLSNTRDVLSSRLGLGEALGGLILRSTRHELAPDRYYCKCCIAA